MWIYFRSTFWWPTAKKRETRVWVDGKHVFDRQNFTRLQRKRWSVAKGGRKKNDVDGTESKTELEMWSSGRYRFIKQKESERNEKKKKGERRVEKKERKTRFQQRFAGGLIGILKTDWSDQRNVQFSSSFFSFLYLVSILFALVPEWLRFSHNVAFRCSALSATCRLVYVCLLVLLSGIVDADAAVTAVATNDDGCSFFLFLFLFLFFNFFCIFTWRWRQYVIIVFADNRGVSGEGGGGKGGE